MQASVTGQFGETEYPATTAVKHQNLTLHRRFKLADLWTELHLSKIHILRSQNLVLQNITVFGDRAFKEITESRSDIWVNSNR